MITKGIDIRIAVEENSADAIKSATLELLSMMIEKNNIIDNSMISHVIFTLTNDLNAAFPAKFARLELGWKNTAMMCFHELNVPNSLEKCLRVLIVLNCKDDFTPEFVYLKGAANLR